MHKCKSKQVLQIFILFLLVITIFGCTKKTDIAEQILEVNESSIVTVGDSYQKVSVNFTDVILNDGSVDHIVLANTINDGNATLNNITAGLLEVFGGGENSIYLNGSRFDVVDTKREDGAIRLVLDDDSIITKLNVVKNSQNVSFNGRVDELNVEASDITVNAIDATLKKITVTGANTTVFVDKDSTVDEVYIDQLAVNSMVIIEGQVKSLVVSGSAKIVVSGHVFEIIFTDGADESTLIVLNGGSVGLVNTQVLIYADGEGKIDEFVIGDNGKVEGDLALSINNDEPTDVSIMRYNVTFLDHNNVVLAVEKVIAGKAAVGPLNPTRNGHTFVGWDKDISKINSSLVVTALYRINQYTVRFNTNAGSAISDLRVNFNGLINRPVDPTKDYHVFDGWYLDDAFTRSWDFSSFMPAHDLTLYAKWSMVEVSEISISAANDETILLKNETLAFDATVLPVDASNQNVTWQVNDGTGSGTIDANGVFTAISAGTVTIQATAQADPTIIDTYELTIVNVMNITQETGSDTIQNAINSAYEYDTIVVASGTYYEQLYIDKPLTLLGPNADLCGYSSNRVAEAIITYQDNIDARYLRLLLVVADDVVVKGFHFENHQLNQPYSGQSEIYFFLSENNEFSNNRVEVLVSKIALRIVGTQNPSIETHGYTTVKGNYIESAYYLNSTVYIEGIGGEIEENVIVSDYIGLYILPYRNTYGGTVRNNDISSYSNSINHAYAYYQSERWLYQGNNLSARVPTLFEQLPEGMYSNIYRGIIYMNTYLYSDFDDNNIDGSAAYLNGSLLPRFDDTNGILFYNIDTAPAFSSSGNIITKVTYGVHMVGSNVVDLNMIAAENTFDDGYVVDGNYIRRVE